MFIRAYLRASTDDQDATRARRDLEGFAADHGTPLDVWSGKTSSAGGGVGSGGGFFSADHAGCAKAFQPITFFSLTCYGSYVISQLG